MIYTTYLKTYRQVINELKKRGTDAIVTSLNHPHIDYAVNNKDAIWRLQLESRRNGGPDSPVVDCNGKEKPIRVDRVNEIVYL